MARCQSEGVGAWIWTIATGWLVVKRLAWIFVPGLLALGGCVSSSESAFRALDAPKRIAAGKPTALDRGYLTFNDKCQPQPRPTGRLVGSPSHGSAHVIKRHAAAIYGPGPYEHCNGKVGPALGVEYTSHPDYRGPDAFEARIRYADGEIRIDRFVVEVY
jgi:hypothetical protein